MIQCVEAIVEEKKIICDAKFNFELDFDQLEVLAAINASDFKRIISNLINNSIDAVSVFPGKILISVRSYTENIQIQILDNGCGMSPENLCKIGTKGFSLSDSGNGLGIYHAKKTIEEMNGSFQVSSRVGEGTMVTITLKAH